MRRLVICIILMHASNGYGNGVPKANRTVGEGTEDRQSRAGAELGIGEHLFADRSICSNAVPLHYPALFAAIG